MVANHEQQCEKAVAYPEQHAVLPQSHFLRRVAENQPAASFPDQTKDERVQHPREEDQCPGNGCEENQDRDKGFMVREFKDRFTQSQLRQVIDRESQKAKEQAAPVRVCAFLPDDYDGDGEDGNQRKSCNQSENGDEHPGSGALSERTGSKRLPCWRAWGKQEIRWLAGDFCNVPDSVQLSSARLTFVARGQKWLRP